MRNPALQVREGLVPRTPPRGCGFAGGSCGSLCRPRPLLGFLRPGRGELCTASLPRGAQLSWSSSTPVYRTHETKPCNARELALGMIELRAVGACQLHPEHAGTPVCPVALSCRAQDEGQACRQPLCRNRALPSGVSPAHRLRARRTKGTGHAPRGRQNNKEGDKSLSNGFSLRNTNVSEPGSPPAQLLGERDGRGSSLRSVARTGASSSDRPQLCSHPGRGDRGPSPSVPSATLPSLSRPEHSL